MSLLEGPKAERQANRLAHLKTAIFLWHSCWIFPLFSQWTRPQGTIFNLTKFLPHLRVHGQIYIPWGNVFSSLFFSTGTKFGDASFWVLETTGDMGQSNLWDILLQFETNSVQAGLRIMQSNFYLQHYFRVQRMINLCLLFIQRGHSDLCDQLFSCFFSS